MKGLKLIVKHQMRALSSTRKTGTYQHNDYDACGEKGRTN